MSYEKPSTPIRHAQMFEILRQTHQADLTHHRQSVLFGESDDEAEALRFQALALRSLTPEPGHGPDPRRA